MRDRAAAIHDARRDEAYLLLWENGAIVLRAGGAALRGRGRSDPRFRALRALRHRRRRRAKAVWATALR